MFNLKGNLRAIRNSIRLLRFFYHSSKADNAINAINTIRLYADNDVCKFILDELEEMSTKINHIIYFTRFQIDIRDSEDE